MSQAVSERTHAAAPGAPEEAPETGLRPLPWFGLRAVFVALLLLPVTCYWASESLVDVIVSLMVPPVAILFVLIILGAGWRALFRRTLLTTTELVIIYGMLQTGTAIAAEWMWVIHPLIAGFSAFSQRDTRFAKLIIPYLPSQLQIQDKALLGPYVTGGVTWHEYLRLLPGWSGPVFWWTVLVFLLCFAMLCINALMRQEWTDREKLSFPIIQLPLAMTEGGPGFWRSRWMWGGFLVAFGIDIWNGFSFMYPVLPTFYVRFLGDLQQAFRTFPFNAIGWTPIGFFPFIVGLSIFLPTDLLFSVLFFFFARKATQVVVASFGYSQGVFGGGGLVPSPPYFSEQTWGAFLGLFVSALWVARSYLGEVWRDVVTGASCPDGGIPRRWALAGLVVSYAGLGWLGMSWGIGFTFTLIYLGLFLMFSVALTRMRAQLGPPTHEMAFMGPTQLLVDFRGTQALPVSLISRTVTIFHLTNRIHRSHPMPTQLELMKLGERTRTSQGMVFVAVLLAVIGGSVFGHLTHIWHDYKFGGDLYPPSEVAGVVDTLTSSPRVPNPVAMAMVGFGFLMVLGLNYLRFQLPWFPLNPMGYALAMNFGVDYFWFGMLFAWIVKSAVQRVSGLKGYAKLHQVALGVILGEFAAEMIWSTVTMTTQIATYSISINGRLGWNQ